MISALAPNGDRGSMTGAGPCLKWEPEWEGGWGGGATLGPCSAPPMFVHASPGNNGGGGGGQIQFTL